VARDRASIRIDMWADEDWRALTVGAQHLYMLLLSHPTLSYAGVADWREGRLAAMTKNRTEGEILGAAAELQRGLFVLVDDSTEEVLVRSFVKHDGLLKQPKLAVSMANAYAAVASANIREVIAFEVQKLHKRHPELSAWTAKQVQTILAAKATGIVSFVEGFTPPVTPVFTPPVTPDVRGSSGQGLGEPTATATATATSTDVDLSSSELRPEVQRLCILLRDLIVANGSKKPTIGKTWTDAARLMLVADGRDADAAERLMRWCQADSYWKANVMSMPTFRKKYDQLRLKAERERVDRQQHAGKVPKDQQIFDVLETGRRLQAEHDRKALEA